MASGSHSGWLRRLLGQPRQPPHVPEGARVYAVGDIHGRRDLLERLLAKITAHAASKPLRNSLVFLGDYVDRGLKSKDVIDYLLALKWPDWEIVFLRGNHEQMVLDFINDSSVYRAWRGFGAAETLISYGVRPPSFDDGKAFAEARDDFARKLPLAHLEFLNSLKYFHVAGDFLFVHGGVRPGIALDRQSPEDMMLIREDFLRSDLNLGKVVVHGHSPSDNPVRLSNRIDVDTGAYATDRLTAVALDEENCSFLSTIDN